MPEKSPDQKRGMIEASLRFEEAWKICADHVNHSPIEVTEAVKFLREQIRNFSDIMRLEKDGDDPTVSHEEMLLVIQGLYHYGFTRNTNPKNN